MPDQYCKAISSIYQNPQFRVKLGNEESDLMTQSTGIRQGWPLSPYLFIILVTVLNRDVHDGLDLSRQTVRGLNFNELLYADDTALITTTAPSMNKLVKKIDHCARYFGLKFNYWYSKYVALNCNTNQATKFKDETKIQKEAETMYLGAQIRKDHCVRREISKKIGSFLATMTK